VETTKQKGKKREGIRRPAISDINDSEENGKEKIPASIMQSREIISQT
jgi:hypothetical protein